jgi:hypothetical protein
LGADESDGRLATALDNRDQLPRDRLHSVYGDAQTTSAALQHWLWNRLGHTLRGSNWLDWRNGQKIYSIQVERTVISMTGKIKTRWRINAVD